MFGNEVSPASPGALTSVKPASSNQIGRWRKRVFIDPP
jgi:hypothetical protein